MFRLVEYSVDIQRKSFKKILSVAMLSTDKHYSYPLVDVLISQCYSVCTLGTTNVLQRQLQRVNIIKIIV
jgi:spore coat polysaccharide biosynthesis protein SpsF (cytidylyltransferase family)